MQARAPRRGRRRFVRNIGAALLTAPFAELFVAPRRVRARPVSKRLIFWFTPNGTVHRFWRPQGSGSDFTFPSGSILEPLDRVKNKLVILDGLDFAHLRGGSHEGGMEHMLTGGGAESVDQFIAAELGAETPFPSIELGVHTSAWGAGVQTRMCYDKSHKLVHPEDVPLNAYNRLFGKVATGAAGMADPVTLARQSVIDLVREELADLQKGLGVSERRKLDAHLESLRRIERRLASSSTMSPTTCGGAKAPPAADARSNDRFPEIGGLQMDVLVAAAACGLSRVLSLQWSHTVSPTIMSWVGASEGHHELSHKDDGNAAGVAAFVKTERWFAEQFALFLDKLAAVKEPDGSGSLLDTSTVVWVKELGDGRRHDHKAVPFVVAGGGNGHFKLGRYLKLNSVPHQRLLTTLCQAMGLTTDTFGAGNYQGPLTELWA